MTDTRSIPPGGRSRDSELEIGFAILLVLSGVYVAYELLADPAGGHPFGHWLGIVGTLLMLMTETLYSIRKRTRLLNWAGPVRRWLSFHIVTGLVGPFLVLMHTGLQFRGLAGVAFALTIVVVASGFLGRYLYTALPRRLSGVEQTHGEMASEARRLGAELLALQEEKPERVRAIVADLQRRQPARSPFLSLVGRSFFQWRFRRQLRRALLGLVDVEVEQRRELRRLLDRQRELARQMETLETARRYTRLWHMAHIPLGLTLFFSVAVHIAAALFFRAGIFGS